MFSKFFVNRPVFSWVISLVIMLAGVLSIVGMPVSQYPQIAPPEIVISAQYPGASAETIENTVTQVIEQKLTGLDGYMYMNSSSDAAGQVSITVTFEAGTDPDIAQVQVQNKIQVAVTTLPSIVQKLGVAVEKTSANFLMVLGFISQDPSFKGADIGDFLSNSVSEPISRVEGVGEVTVFGASYAMRVWLNPEELVKYKLVPMDINRALMSQNAQVSTGAVGAQPTNGQQVLTATVNSSTMLKTVDEFNQILIKTLPNGAAVYLKDVAKVEVGQDNYMAYGTFNGRPSAGLAIKMASGANALETQKNVLARVEELKSGFPEGIEVVIPFDTTPFVKAALSEVLKTLAEAIVLVVVVMFLFLQNWRATLIPTIAVPVVLLGTFGVVAAAGFSINMLTMFAMVLAIGLLVDDAIVVVENVERVMREDGTDAKTATIKSMGQITSALIGIALVLSAVFIPMAFFGGSTGVIYRQFSITIVSAMALSVLVALTLTPALCAALLKPINHEEHQNKSGFFGKFNRGFEAMTHGVKQTVSGMLGRMVRVMLVYAVIIAAVVVGFIKVPTGFMPSEDQGILMMQTQLPAGATMERTSASLQKVEGFLKKTEAQNLESVFFVRGFSFAGSGQNMAMGFLKLKDWSERTSAEQRSDAIANRSMPALLFGEPFKDAQTYVFSLPAVPELGVADGFDFFIQDMGGHTHNELTQVMNKFLAAANQDPRLTMVRHNGMGDTPQIKLELDYPKVLALDLDIDMVNSTIATALGGDYVNDYLDRGRIKRVWVMGQSDARMQPEDLARWHVRNKKGEMVSLSSFMTAHWENGSPRLERFNGLGAVNIQGNPQKGVSSGQAMQAIEEVAAKTFPPGYQISWNGVSYQERQSGDMAGALYALSLLVVFLCLAALYESWSIPISVMLVVPCGVVGALGATYLLNMQNDVYFQVGLLTTIGLVSKNAILIVEFAKEAFERGEDALHAAVEAVRLRLRPILMTSIAFGLGVLPLAVAFGPGSGAQNAIGVGVLGGMLTGTFLCIVFVPTFYVLILRLFSGQKMIQTSKEDSTDLSTK